MPGSLTDPRERSLLIPEDATALIGGRFDPFHLGHLHIAERILALKPVTKAAFLPNDRHGFKDIAVLGFEQRYKLICRAIAGHPGLECWDADSSKHGNGWTDDLMQRLTTANPGSRFCFVIGADNLESLNRWHNFSWLAENLHFIIVPRAGCGGDLSNLTQIRYTWIDMPLLPFSSSDIRSRIRAGDSIAGMVPEAIEAVIIQLYRSAG